MAPRGRLPPAHVGRLCGGGDPDESPFQRASRARGRARDHGRVAARQARARRGHVRDPARPRGAGPDRCPAARRAVAGDGGRGRRCRGCRGAGAGRCRAPGAVVPRARGARGDSADRAAAAGAEGVLADAARPCAAGLAPSGRAREAGDHGCVGGGFPKGAGRARLHRDLDAEDRRFGYRERRERLRARLLRPAGVPRPEPAVLQADDGGRLRARLRDREGLARRAARDWAAPRRVHLARRGARLHPRPLRRDGRGSRGDRRDGRRHPRAGPRGGGAAGGAGRDPVGALLARPASTTSTSRRRTNAGCARSTASGCS